MMKHSLKTGFVFFILYCVSGSIWGRSVVDSVIHQRNETYLDYKHFIESMEARTWINMVNLTTKAKAVVEIDNDIINYYLFKELEKNKKYSGQIEKLNMEIAMLKKESEVRKMVLEEKRFLLNVLFIIIGTISILFLIILILFIDRQVRYRSVKVELERAYSGKEDYPTENDKQQEVMELNMKTGRLNSEISTLKSEIIGLKKANMDKEEELQKEISSRKQVEEEIRELIKQIKSYGKS